MSANPQEKTTQEKPEEKPHYHGHRDRLRARFRDNGADALQDYELLELLLFMAIPRRDVKPLAKTLLMKFGGLQEIMNATINELTAVSGISEATALGLKAMTALSHRASKQELMGKPVLNSWPRLMDYCHATMAHEKTEMFRVFFLNRKNHLISDDILQRGSVDHLTIYPREVIKRALEVEATAIILVHNHPSGDMRPSSDDINMTHALTQIAEPLKIKIHDHIIITKTGFSSFKTMGLL